MARKRKMSKPGMPTKEAFLRSINIVLDAEEASRISHFVPTAKSVSLVRALMGHDEDRAVFIVAPYGSGKSLTASYVLHLTENRSGSVPVLQSLSERLDHVSPELGQFARARLRNRNSHGLVLALHSYAASVPNAIRDAALAAFRRMKLGREGRTLRSLACDNIDQLVEFLVVLQDKCARSGMDRIIVLWDEFGKHLDGLALEGRSGSLMELQQLAEFVSRASTVMTLGLMLHQGLLHYAGGLSQAARSDWMKVEGRFKTIDFVDTSKQVFSLIGQVVASRQRRKKPGPRAIGHAARESKKLGLFAEFGLQELRTLLREAYPLSPIALHLLPRISARVGQNERTLFNYLFAMSLDHVCMPSSLYDYFSGQMRSDISVGGTHRQWLETESAISKADDIPEAASVLKTACLLGLGLGGERPKTSLELLRFALNGYRSGGVAQSAMGQLIAGNLLLHRSHSSEVTVWHGTDLDIRGRLESEKNRRRSSFDLAAYLQTEFLPPCWRPHEYNAEYGVRRYLSGRYTTAAGLSSELTQLAETDLPIDCDGMVLYVLPDNQEGLAEASAQASRLVHERIVVVAPQEVLPIREASLESYCLLAMQSDTELISADPLALDEIKQLADDSHDHLQRIIDRVVRPSPQGPRWFYRGQELETDSPKELRSALSQMMGAVYAKTPRFNNEMIVRKKLSAVVINARKKLLLGILERSGKRDLGLQGNFPDASMFRTVLLHTGLYRCSRGKWQYAKPKAREIADPGLRAVWARLGRFFSIPCPQPKEPASLIRELMSPPFGLRAGVIPILIAAALKAFSRAVSLTRKGKYVADILPTVIEDLCRNPQEYRLWVLEIKPKQAALLKAVRDVFGGEGEERTEERDLVRACYDELNEWKADLPPAARTSTQISADSSRFRDMIFRMEDPVESLVTELPALLKGRRSQMAAREALRRAKSELEALVLTYSARAEASLRDVLAKGSGKTGFSLRELAQSWASCFADEMLARLAPGVARGMLTRMKTQYDTDSQLLDSLSSLLTGRTLARWDDKTVAEFDRRLRDTVRLVEERALETEDLVVGEKAAHGLARLAGERIARLVDRLTELVGPEEAARLVGPVLARLSDEGHAENGDYRGRTG